MPAPASSRPRQGGIRKHQQRRDRDGDVSMGAAPRTAPARPAQRKDNHSGHKPSSASFVELKVTGWTDEKEMVKLINFLERHSSRRSAKVPRGGVPPKMIKRHRVVGEVLTISVRQEDVSAFGKINGFTFASTHGSQKLNISGPGIRSKSPTSATVDGQDQRMTGAGTGGDKKDTSATVELLQGFLGRRYDPSNKLLNFSNIASDEEVLKSGMFDTLSTQKKFFPALMVVCGQTLKSAEEKKAAIESVTLSGNNLPNLDVVRDLSIELPHIKNLDISGNKFESLAVLKPWKNRFRQLEQLIVDPFTTSGWEEEITAWFPKLQKLNSVEVRTEQAPTPAAPAPIATENAPAGSALTPQQEEMVVYVQRETKLKREMAIQCLVAAEWNLEKAGELFQATKLGPEAFE